MQHPQFADDDSGRQEETPGPRSSAGGCANKKYSHKGHNDKRGNEAKDSKDAETLAVQLRMVEGGGLNPLFADRYRRNEPESLFRLDSYWRGKMSSHSSHSFQSRTVNDANCVAPADYSTRKRRSPSSVLTIRKWSGLLSELAVTTAENLPNRRQG